uniref:Fucosyltransferase n=1 Tax=Parastrongyloides trichosuri TaxID=131310 RepID=A0A0N4ZM12_PARTI
MFDRCSLTYNKQGTCRLFDYEYEGNVIESCHFYFALENVVCRNYITEKYIYIDAGIPNNSFIETDDSKSAKEMMEYLNFFIDNPNEYLKYFNYRKGNMKVIRKEETDQTHDIYGTCNKLQASVSDNKIMLNPLAEHMIINKCIFKKDME